MCSECVELLKKKCPKTYGRPKKAEEKRGWTRTIKTCYATDTELNRFIEIHSSLDKDVI